MSSNGPSSRYGVVLALVLVNVLFVAAAPGGAVSRLVSTILAGAVATVAMSAGGTRAGVRTAVHALVALAVLGSAVAAVTGGGAVTRALIALGSGVLVVIAPLVIWRGLLRHLRRHGVDLRAVAGALAIYLLVGMFFAFLIVGISELATGPYFAGRHSSGQGADVYFSFITLATVGYGDYTPALGVGRALAILEGIAGQLYLVTVVALLIGNLRGSRVAPAEAADGASD